MEEPVKILVESLDGEYFTEYGKDEEGKAVLRVFDKSMKLIDVMYPEAAQKDSVKNQMYFLC